MLLKNGLQNKLVRCILQWSQHIVHSYLESIYIYYKSCLPRSKAFCVILKWHNDIFINGQKRLYDIFEKTSHFFSQKKVRRLITICPKELIELYELSAFAICIKFGLFDIYFLVNTVTQNSIQRLH